MKLILLFQVEEYTIKTDIIRYYLQYHSEISTPPNNFYEKLILV